VNFSHQEDFHWAREGKLCDNADWDGDQPVYFTCDVSVKLITLVTLLVGWRGPLA